MDPLSFPFRLFARRPVTVKRDSDAFGAQRIVAAFLTESAELPITPAYGTGSPIFNRLDVSTFISTVSTYYPDIEITNIEENVAYDGTINVGIGFNLRINASQRG